MYLSISEFSNIVSPTDAEHDRQNTCLTQQNRYLS
jgi:hypothetical protein